MVYVQSLNLEETKGDRETNIDIKRVLANPLEMILILPYTLTERSYRIIRMLRGILSITLAACWLASSIVNVSVYMTGFNLILSSVVVRWVFSIFL